MKNVYFFILFIFYPFFSEAQFTTNILYESPDSQINVYIVSQGYTNASMNNFNNFVDGFLANLWTISPYAQQKTRFRIIRVNHPSSLENLPAAYFQFENVTNLAPYISVPSSSPQYNQYTTNECYANFKTRMDNLKVQLPGFNNKSYIIGIFNNNYYTAGGGEYTFTSTFGNNAYMYNVLVHEFSHTFGLLGDEYSRSSSTPYQKDPINCNIIYDSNNNPIYINPSSFPLFQDRNVTDKISLNSIPWKYLITNTSLPICPFSSSCPSNGIGLYDGANYSIDASPRWYRSDNDCKMKSVNSPFCQVCLDLINERISEHLCYPTNIVNENFMLKHQYINHWRKASNLITSNSQIASDITVNFVSGSSILLMDGFNAKSGSEFYAYVGDCSIIPLINSYRTTTCSLLDITSSPKIKPVNSLILEDNDLKISPNPANSFITLQSKKSKIIDIVIYSVDGSLVYKKEIEKQNSVSVDISKFENGLYIINVKNEFNEVLNRKIIKK